MAKKRPSSRPRRAGQSSEEETPRLQKVLAAAGYGSRRQCEELILEGRVEIDRQVRTELGTRVDPGRQEIRVDGERLKLPKVYYFAVNKPVGVVSTAKDPWARTRVIDLVPGDVRLFTVGRLDRSSSGLILVTNDGELANKLAHPRYHVEKTYRVTVAGRPSADALRTIRKGVHLAEAVARVVNVQVKRATDRKSVLEIVLAEGRNREIRRILARVGHKVLELERIAIGPVRLGELPEGAYRELKRDEVAALQAAVRGQTGRRTGARRKTGRSGGPTGAAGAGPGRPGKRTGTVIGEQKKSEQNRGGPKGRGTPKGGRGTSKGGRGTSKGGRGTPKGHGRSGTGNRR